MGIEDLTIDDIFEVLEEQFTSAQIQPDEITVRQYAERASINIRPAYERLEKMVAMGRMTSRWVLSPDNGRKCRAHRLVK